MPRVVGIDHLVLSVGNFARSKDFYGKVLGFLGFKLKHDVSRHGGLEQRQDPVLDRRRRRQGQDAQIPQGRHRLSPLRVRAFEPQGRGRARRLPGRARHERGRSARRILRALVLRGLFHRPRRHEARRHGVQAAAEAKAGAEETAKRRRPGARSVFVLRSRLSAGLVSRPSAESAACASGTRRRDPAQESRSAIWLPAATRRVAPRSRVFAR